MGLVYTDRFGGKRISVSTVVSRYLGKYPLVYYRGEYREYDSSTGIWNRIDSIEQVRIRIARYAEKITNLHWSNQYKEEANEQIRVQVKEVEQMDVDDTKVCLKNCVIDIVTGETFHFSKDYLFTARFDIEYDPDSTCPLTKKFLKQVCCGNADREKALVEFIGLVFTKKNCSQALLLLGSGANGKSVFCNLLAELLGSDNYTSITLAELKSFGTGKLPGKRLAIMSEISKADSESLMTTELKQVITGEVMSGNIKYKPLFDFRPYAKVLILSNHMIGFSDDSTTGATRRFHIIPFELQLSEEERDDRLLDKLLNEKSGIFNLAVEGYRRYVANNNVFSSSEESKKIIKDILRTENPIAEFVKDTIIFDATSFVAYERLRTAYKSWCDENDVVVSAPDGRSLFKEISQKGKVKSHKSNGYRGIKGICLRE